MSDDFSDAERAGIEASISARYAAFASGGQGLFRFSTGRAGLDEAHYPPEALAAVPAAVQNAFCGVGNPFALGAPRPGCKILDIGCGAGLDVWVAAFFAGPGGLVYGLEASPDMLAMARRYGRNAIVDVESRAYPREPAESRVYEPSLARMHYFQGRADCLPFVDKQFDLIISNGVFNLVIDKEQACREAFRVLKDGGRLQMADQILAESIASPAPGSFCAAERAAAWGR